MLVSLFVSQTEAFQRKSDFVQIKAGGRLWSAHTLREYPWGVPQEDAGSCPSTHELNCRLFSSEREMASATVSLVWGTWKTNLVSPAAWQGYGFPRFPGSCVWCDRNTWRATPCHTRLQWSENVQFIYICIACCIHTHKQHLQCHQVLVWW